MGLYLPLTSLTRSSCSRKEEEEGRGGGVEGEEDSNSRWWTLISRAGAAWIDKLEICTGSGASIIIGYPLCRLWKPFREMIFSDYLRWLHGDFIVVDWRFVQRPACRFKRIRVFFLPLLLLLSFFLSSSLDSTRSHVSRNIRERLATFREGRNWSIRYDQQSCRV